MTRPLRFALALLAALAPGLAAGPAAAQFMTPEDEARIGAEQHPKILEEFGGAYDDPALAAYVDRVGQRLVRVSDMPNQRFTFTVLNSSMVNAFALPGGYVYVTRGLLALANNEAELAGVLAHEIGHVVARHGAERYNQTMIAQILAVGAGLALGDQAAAQMFGAAAAPVLASYSREHEFEADTFGVRYLARANYDPLAMATFLRHLGNHAELEARIMGREVSDQFNLLATHPRTPQRVRQAIQHARVQSVPAPNINGIVFLEAIDGISIDGDMANGFRKDRRFYHPRRGFTFAIPEEFRPVKSDGESLIALGPDGAFAQFDWVDRRIDVSMTDYISRVWAPDARLSGLQSIDVNGMEAATATTRAQTDSGPVDVRLVAIRSASRTVHRFMFVTPPNLTAAFDERFRRSTNSFRRMSRDEVAAAGPLRLGIIQAGPADTVQSLASRLPYDRFRVDRFRVMNGLLGGREVAPGQYLKMVVE